MKSLNIKGLFKNKAKGNIIILTASIVLVYLFISLYFINHYFFNTVINGVNVSLKAHDGADNLFKSYIKNYELQLIERNNEVEKIKGQDISMQYNEKNSIVKVYKMQNSFNWIISLFKKQEYFVDDLYIYNKYDLENKINELNCLNKDIVEPQNVSFKYSNGLYEVVKEVYGNKINTDKLYEAVEMSILEGKARLDLNESLCYENPRYTLSSAKTLETKNLLNKYVKTKITYMFGSESEVLDGNTINQWLSVDENLDVVISEIAVMRYVRDLGIKYDTAGAVRNFKTSIGKTVEVKGGIYGWKINQAAETKTLLKNIKLGKVIIKEPEYSQRALYRDKNDIGNTYVEINITRQHLWFYKNGRLVTQGDVVTGNPNRGNSTKVGVYMLNYKEEGSTLRGENYESEVAYWMPFYGNIGIHDASWRYSFGGDIYKTNGTHGCVNAPLYLAKKIYDNIEDGTPIICYKE